MGNIFKAFTNSFKGVKLNNVKNISIFKKIIFSSVILFIIANICIIAKRAIQRKFFPDLFMEEYFKNTCGKLGLLNDKKTRKDIDTQQFSALRAAMKGDITFSSLFSVLKFGLDRDKTAMSKDIALNPALFDDKKKFEYNLEKNSSAKISAEVAQACEVGDESATRLSSEEKLVYTGLATISGFNRFLDRITKQSSEMNKLMSGSVVMPSKEMILEGQTTKLIIKAYVKCFQMFSDLVTEKDIDIDKIVDVIGETLLDKKDADISTWSDPVMVDKTSLVLMLRALKSFKNDPRDMTAKKVLVLKMVLNRELFDKEKLKDSESFDEVKSSVFDKEQSILNNRITLFG